MNIQRIAAFTDGAQGGNPAGVVLGDRLPDDLTMQRVAAEVGFSETAFAAPDDAGWRVRYFSPQTEVPFCGHATIALGAALALRFGDGVFSLTLNQAEITVDAQKDGERIRATLASPSTSSTSAEPALIEDALAVFGLGERDLDPRIPPARVHGGADHLLFALETRDALAAMRYDLDAGRDLMRRAEIVTVILTFAESPSRFHARNPFASGGVYEDPATGAAAAALAGYLRDIGWPHGGAIDIIQGEDMGVPSRLHAEISETPGSSIRVSGTARVMSTETGRGQSQDFTGG